MIVEVDVETGEVTLADPRTFTEFHVAAAGPAERGIDAVVGALGADGCVSDRDDHVWVSKATIRRLAAADSKWDAEFEAMCEYAAGKGWVDPTGECLAAHVVWVGS